MKKYAFLFVALLLMISCDDGDKIITNFNFDSDSALKHCKSGSNNVLYITNSNPNEAIAFNFSDEDFDGTYSEDDISQTINITLNDNNRLIYRTFNHSVSGSSYFCSGIPPTEPKVNQEYHSKNGGYIEVTTYLVDQEYDEVEETITRFFETYAIAHDITLKNVNKDEEIVEETLKLGFFESSGVYDLSDLEEDQ